MNDRLASARQSFPKLRASGGFVWRTPLLPVADLTAFGAGLTATATFERDGPAELEAAVAADRVTLRDRLATVVQRPEVREAIAVASPGLDAAIDTWRREPTSKRGRSVERGLVRYLTRMTTRPTPFGLLAGTATGEVGAATDLALGPRDAYRRHSQIDTDVLAALVDHLATDPALLDHVTVRPNDSHYRVAGQVRYVQAHQDGTRRAYRLATLPDHPAVRTLFAVAEHGASLDELVVALVDDGHDPQAARRAVTRLIERQALVADLGFGVTGTTSARRFIDDLTRLEATRPVATTLAAAADLLDEVDASGLGAAPDRYRDVATTLQDLSEVTIPDDPFHVVLTKPTVAASLGPRVLAAAERAVSALHAASRLPVDGALERFRDAFLRRYDTHEVPLVEVLDGDAGLGYGGSAHPTPLLRGLPFPEAPATGSWTARDEWLLRRTGLVTARGERELRLDDADLDALRDAGQRPPPPRALAVFGTLLADSGDAVDRGDFRLAVDGAMGPSGARLLGRFCHADGAVHRIVTDHLRAEEATDPDAIHAEVVHLPPGREGNVVLRPVLRDTEIPYLGRSGAPSDRQLPISDLLVSVRDGRVVLRSRRHGRRVEPRLSSAHNAQRRSSPLYRFLVDVQQQGVAGGLAWDWGPLTALPFLPRVTTGELILSPATWRLETHELADVHDLDDGARFAAVRRWQARRDVPERFRVAQYDRRLVVVLGNALSLDSFLHLVRRHADTEQPVTLQEAFLDDDQLLARGPEGRFTHELIVPLVRAETPDPPPDHGEVPLTRTASHNGSVRRRFPPGSSWLYAKLYAGASSADAALTEGVTPLLAQLRETGGLDGWFFLRMNDPDDHLRLRLHGEPRWLTDVVWPALQAHLASLLDDGRIHRLQIDTYERELDALGGPAAIAPVEQLFRADSDAALGVLANLPRGDAGLDARWRVTLLGMHRALLDLGLDLDARRALVAELRDGSAREHRVDTATKRELGRRFREERPAIEALLADDPDPPEALRGGVAALDPRRHAWAAPIAELRTLADGGRLTVPWSRIAERTLHLHANRMLRAAQRRQECVLYDFLARLYDGEVARADR